MDKLLIFAGTYEGRVLCEFLSKNSINCVASVATEYGQEVIGKLQGIKVIQGRLNQEEIETLIKKENFEKIVDATHPYAHVVSENIKKACKITKTKYIRLLREESSEENLISVSDIPSAVKLINELEGNVLLTTGSKELAKYKGINDFEKRVFARVLPSKQVLESCEELGIKGRNLICMQGPFSKELNRTMLKDFNCSMLITKNTGDVGGFREKVQAAKEIGAKVIVIERPKEGVEIIPSQVHKDYENKDFIEREKTYTLEEVKAMLVRPVFKTDSVKENREKVVIGQQNHDRSTVPVSFRYFPTFVDSVNKLVVIVGAGEIALGRALKLKQFGFRIKMVSKHFCYKIDDVLCIEKGFEDRDIEEAFLVIAATDDRAVNSHIARLCKSKNILCSIADKGDEGSFIFPALIGCEEGLIALSSDGKNPKATKALATKMREILSSKVEI